MLESSGVLEEISVFTEKQKRVNIELDTQYVLHRRNKRKNNPIIKT